MASIDRTIEGIDARFDRIEARLDRIEAELHRLNGRLTMIGFGFAATQVSTTTALIVAFAG